MRRALLVIAIVLLAAAPAQARWTAGGSGTGSGSTATLAGGQTPTATVSGQTVTVSFSQTQFRGSALGGYANGGYTVRRSGTAVTSGTCAGTVSGGGATLSCTDTGVAFGDYTYTVAPKLDDSWTGVQSPASATAEVAPNAPTTLTATPATGAVITLTWSAVTGATGYAIYRGTTPGTYGASPIATVGAVTTYADTGANGTTYYYVVRAVAAGNESPNSPQASAVADSSAPTGVVLANPGTPLRQTVTLSATASDAGSGIASVQLQYAPTGTTNWTDACTATISPYSCTWNTTGVGDAVYDLRAVATDRAGYTTASATVASHRVDNTAPATTLTDPGSPLHATVSLVDTATDTGGSGIANVKVQRSPTGTSTWTDICSTATATACSFNTTTVADATYDLRVLATDAAGNTATTVVAARVIDNTKPTGTDVQAANKTGGTVGVPEAGDTITFTFSEAMKPSSVLTGWTGAATPVTVRISAAASGVLQVYNSANTALLPFGNITLGRRTALVAMTFATSSMTMSGSTITVTLGTASGTANPVTGAAAMAWAVPATATDLAGNVITAATINESGAPTDLDF